MFTGIIQAFGFIENIKNKENIYTIKTNLDLNNINIGSSICCDGVCLTAINIMRNEKSFLFSVNVSEESLKRSNIINWKLDSIINLEKSLIVGNEISGHFVYGHVDSVINIENINKLQNSWEFEFSFFNLHKIKNINSFIVEKGSVTINGISLTVANVLKKSFIVSVIPHTYINTNLSVLKKDDIVNIEFDPLARYISKRYDN